MSRFWKYLAQGLSLAFFEVIQRIIFIFSEDEFFKLVAVDIYVNVNLLYISVSVT